MKNLSGGELQRVAITLALGLPADVYLIDEPSAYLDSEQRIIAAKVHISLYSKNVLRVRLVDLTVTSLLLASTSSSQDTARNMSWSFCLVTVALLPCVHLFVLFWMTTDKAAPKWCIFN